MIEPVKQSVPKNSALNGYFQQRIFNEIIKKTDSSANNKRAKFKSYHSRLLEKKLDDGWNRMRGKMKKLVDYDAPNSDDSSDSDDNYETSYSYKFMFESSSLPKWKTSAKKSPQLQHHAET